MTWRKVAHSTARTLTIGLVAFGLHYIIYGGADGIPYRGSLAIGLVAYHCLGAGRNWTNRGRFLATLPFIFALIGIGSRQDLSRVVVWMVLAIPLSFLLWFFEDRRRTRAR